MKLAYFSPLNPLKSGISDYSEELLPELAKHAEIDLYVDNYKTSWEGINNFRVYNLNEFDQKAYHNYDHAIYHMGNNFQYHSNIYRKALEFPGITVLHDYSIHHLIANLTVAQNDWAGYIEEMEYNYGPEGRRFAELSQAGKMKVMWESQQTLKYPANKRLVDRSKAVIVHSNMARNGIIQTKPDSFVQYAPLFTSDVTEVGEEEKSQLRKQYHIEQDHLVLASFGYVSSAKRIESILETMSQLKKKYSKITYLIVGEEEENGYSAQKDIIRLGLQKECKYIGYVTLNQFKDYIKLSDVCLNLRYPTQGESSASLLRILGYGKPAIVSNIGSFSEFPNDITMKISYADMKTEIQELYGSIEMFMSNKQLASQMGKAALKYIDSNHRIINTCERYLEVFSLLNQYQGFNKESRFYYPYIDTIVKGREIFFISDTIKDKFSDRLNSFFE